MHTTKASWELKPGDESYHNNESVGTCFFNFVWSISNCCNPQETHDDHATEPKVQVQTSPRHDTSEQQILALVHKLAKEQADTRQEMAKMQQHTQQEMAKMHAELQTLTQVVQESIQLKTYV
jgi:hypothetical protein